MKKVQTNKESEKEKKKRQYTICMEIMKLKKIEPMTNVIGQLIGRTLIDFQT